MKKILAFKFLLFYFYLKYNHKKKYKMLEKIKEFAQAIKQNTFETFKLLKQFKWSISIYVLFYAILLSFYLSPSPKQYCIWNNEDWFEFSSPLYLAITKLMLIIVVQVTMDFVGQIQSHLIAYQYEGLLKKAALIKKKGR